MCRNFGKLFCWLVINSFIVKQTFLFLCIFIKSVCYITVACDRVSNSEDCSIFVVLLQSPTYRSSDSGRLLYFGRFLFLFPTTDFFDIPGPIFAKLCHTTWCVVKYFISYMGVHMCS